MRKEPLTERQVYAIVGAGAALSVCLVVALAYGVASGVGYLLAVWQ